MKPKELYIKPKISDLEKYLREKDIAPTINVIKILDEKSLDWYFTGGVLETKDYYDIDILIASRNPLQKRNFLEAMTNILIDDSYILECGEFNVDKGYVHTHIVGRFQIDYRDFYDVTHFDICYAKDSIEDIKNCYACECFKEN